ncbi:hypothetical protein [Lentibacillus sediminis]|uniref:hypothetical protein n=1 Tax=Lentibacillus sediminis TaxID=1940529 RepID=UPI000C1C6519|nr:hypothetical protein [Lentibacillus sediminis]
MKTYSTAFIFLIAIYFIFTSSVSAHTNNNDGEGDFHSDQPLTLEEIYKIKGYTQEITDPIEQFEDTFSTKVVLPKKMPFDVHRSFGKMNEDNSLSLHFFGENKKDLFQFTINPNEPYKNSVNDQLSNGKEIFIEEINHDPLHIRQLFMKKGEFEYILGINYADEKYKRPVLIETAESMIEQE